MSNVKHHEKGDSCPDCGGTLAFIRIEDCSCHINPPCGACVKAPLCCSRCGWQGEEEPKLTETYRHIGGGISEYVPFAKPEARLGDGKRLYDFDYDSRSGSTMEYRGRYEGPVTTADILAYFGSGTFGHRGPTLSNGRFTFTKITD